MKLNKPQTPYPQNNNQQAPNYYNPQQYPVYPIYQIQKKPVNKGLVALAIIASLTAFICVVGFVMSVLFGLGQATYNANTNSGYNPYDFLPTPPSGNYGGITPDTDEPSDKKEEVKEPEFVIPDIEVQSYKEGIILNSKPTTAELSPNEIYKKVIKSTVTISSHVLLADGSYDEGLGSGIILTSDGFILTNSHVIGDSTSTYVTLKTHDSQEFEAVVVAYDKATDLAIIKADAKNLTPAEFGKSDELEMGDWVMAIGTPGDTSYTGSLTRGIISGLDRAVGYSNDDTMTYIQTDAAINPGNSGGPLVNMYGQVIGINTSKIVADYFEGMGFAIPVSNAEEIIESLLENGYASGRVRLGITASVVDTMTASMYRIPQGVMIQSIDEDSSLVGSKAAIGDIITDFEGTKVTDLTQLAQLFLSYSPGDEVEMTLFRPEAKEGEQEFTITITLLEDKGQTQN